MRLYRALLRLYPASFRAEYGGQLCADFEERRAAASGAMGVLAVWLDAVLELPLAAGQAHFDILRQDLRYAARSLRRAPGFALTAIMVIALGIGATTAAYSVTDHVLLRPLPFAQPDRIVRLWQTTPGYAQMELSAPNYLDWKQMSASFESLGAYHGRAVNLVGEGEPLRLDTATVTREVFPILGVQPVLGRWLDESDFRDGASSAMVLSYRLWQTQFGGDPAVLGRKLLLDGAPYDVVGIMPAGFFFPSRQTQLWTPKQFVRQWGDDDRANNYLNVVARLKPGATLDQARAEMTGIATRLERAYPDANKDTGANVNFLKDEVAAQSRLMLWALLGAALCLLLIACTNLANLLLARALARRRELAVRAALGAGRERLTRQLLTESLTLAVAGGMLGVLVATLAIPLLANLVPRYLPIAEAPSLDLRVLGFAALLTVLTGVAFGVVPALRACREAAVEGLRDSSRTGGGRKERLRAALVIAEVTASVVLLVSSGLLLRALWKLQGVDTGFRSENVLTLRTALPIPKYAITQARAQFYQRVLSEVRTLPGVTHAAYITYLPMTIRGGIWPVSVDGQQAIIRSAANSSSLRYVTPGFFVAMGIPLLAGRDVNEADTIDAPFVAVVSQSFAERFWPGQDPIGRRFTFAFAERTVVGVAGNIRVRGLERDSEPQVYIPYQQVPDRTLAFYSPKDLVIRSSVPPESMIPAVRRIIRDADPEQPVSDVQLLSDLVAGETAPRRAQLRVIGAFALLAFLLAGIGIHGLLSYAVSQRTQEIGIRMALGAQRGDILRLVMRDGFVLAAIGVVLGVGLAYAAGRGIEALLFGVQPSDAPTYLAAVALVLTMTLAGSLLPALRAVRVNPTTAIRAE